MFKVRCLSTLEQCRIFIKHNKYGFRTGTNMVMDKYEPGVFKTIKAKWQRIFGMNIQ